MSRTLLQIVDRISQLRITVLGDFLLDEFLFGEISRVSREAPVLILSYREKHSTPGGAANTVQGVSALGAEVTPVGYLGGDRVGDRLLDLWPAAVERSFVFREPGLKTARKSRILAGSLHSFRQQVVRLDYEQPHHLTAEQQSRVIEALLQVIPKSDALILSDYSLGNIPAALRQKALQIAARFSRIVVADSRFDPAGFASATSITPNISEVEEAIGERIGNDQAKLERLGSRLLQRWRLEALLITRGREGMSLFEPGKVRHIPVYGGDEVADVTGAGDTVIATYTTALAAGASFYQAARLANVAGGIVVTKRGTASVTASELRRVVLAEDVPQAPAPIPPETG